MTTTQYSTKYEMSYDELCDYLSDFHKAVHGFRLRMYGEPLEAIESALARTEGYMESMQQTFDDRQELRNDGWVIDETEPDLIELAATLTRAHEIEMETMYAEMDAQWQHSHEEDYEAQEDAMYDMQDNWK